MPGRIPELWERKERLEEAGGGRVGKGSPQDFCTCERVSAGAVLCKYGRLLDSAASERLWSTGKSPILRGRLGAKLRSCCVGEQEGAPTRPQSQRPLTMICQPWHMSLSKLVQLGLIARRRRSLSPLRIRAFP